MLVEHPATARTAWLWRLGGSLLAVGLLGFGIVQVVSQVAHEQETVTRELDGAGLRSVDVRNDNGDVHIVGTDDDTVRITARVDHGLRRTGRSERIEGDRLVVRGTCPVMLSQFCEVDYDIEVPRDVALTLRVGNERTTVRGVTGAIEARIGNGRIEVVGATGELRLHSGNGRAVGADLSSETVEASTGNGTVELDFRESPRRVDARSGNGRVDVVLPNRSADRDVSYRVDVSSGNGSTAADIRTDPQSDRSITARTGNGSVTVRYPAD